MTEQQEQKVTAALERVFRHYNDAGPLHKDIRTRDFVFHMTDWYEDFMRLAKLYADPTGHTQKQWNDAAFGFLVHAVGHLMAAAKLNGGLLLDPFGVVSTPPKRRRKRTKTTSA